MFALEVMGKNSIFTQGLAVICFYIQFPKSHTVKNWYYHS